MEPHQQTKAKAALLNGANTAVTKDCLLRDECRQDALSSTAALLVNHVEPVAVVARAASRSETIGYLLHETR